MIKRTLLTMIVSLLAACGSDSTSSTHSTTIPSTNPSDKPDVSDQLTNIIPIIILGDKYEVLEKTSVIVRAFVRDYDGDEVTVTWEQLDGNDLDFSAVQGKSIEFIVPEVEEDTEITLRATATDSRGGQNSDTVKIKVKNWVPYEIENSPPKVTVGEDYKVEEGKWAKLSSVSTDEDGFIIKREWVQIEGPTVNLRLSNSPEARFDAPHVDKDTQLVFEVTVTDDKQATSSARQTVLVLNDMKNDRPVIEIQAPTEAGEGEVIDLSASISHKLGLQSSIKWLQTKGPRVEFENSHSRNTKVTMPYLKNKNATIELKASATDTNDQIGYETVTINIIPGEHSFYHVNFSDVKLEKCLEKK